MEQRDLLGLISRWLEEENYEMLFTKCCCAHFAARAHHYGIGDLFYTESKYDKRYKAHVFVLDRSGRAFDINGFNSVNDLLNPVSHWSEREPRPVSLDEVEEDITALGLGMQLDSQIFAAANREIRRLAEEGQR